VIERLLGRNWNKTTKNSGDIHPQSLTTQWFWGFWGSNMSVAWVCSKVIGAFGSFLELEGFLGGAKTSLNGHAKKPPQSLTWNPGRGDEPNWEIFHQPRFYGNTGSHFPSKKRVRPLWFDQIIFSRSSCMGVTISAAIPNHIPALGHHFPIQKSKWPTFKTLVTSHYTDWCKGILILAC